MNIVFLDVDGVLNNDFCVYGQDMDGHNVRMFREAVESVPDCRIVISSSWRMGHAKLDGFLEMCRVSGCDHLFRPLVPLVHEDYGTPWTPGIRGRQVKAWLDAHEGQVERYLCVDDNSDFLPGQPLLLTDYRKGFCEIERNLLQLFFGVTPEHPPRTMDDLIGQQKEEARRLRRLAGQRERFIARFIGRAGR